MNHSTILRQLLKDQRSLEDYLAGNPPKFSTIASRLRIQERNHNRKVPDHYYKNQERVHLENINDLGTLLVEGTHQMASELLEYKNGRVVVKANKLVQWQELITFVSPSFCIASVIYHECKFNSERYRNSDLSAFMFKCVLPSVQHSTLPITSYPQFNELLKEDKGFHDLHVHLSGSTEIDKVFQYFLNNAKGVSREFKKAYFKDEHVIREQLEQEESKSDPHLFFRRLNAARTVRSAICDSLIKPRSSSTTSGKICESILPSKGDIFRASNLIDALVPPTSGHPMSKLFYADIYKNVHLCEIALEVMMYIMTFERIDKTKSNRIAQLLHCYLLIWGSINRMMVQQIDHFGFEQFGKITDNKLRDLIETKFDDRFRQLNGNEQKFLRFLEARFSPKRSVAENRFLLTNIIKDFTEYESKFSSLTKPKCIIGTQENNDTAKGTEPPQLKLVGHFIKKAEKKPPVSSLSYNSVRHASLYREIHKKANALLMVRKDPKFSRYLSGIDAASNELVTPPAVFGPAYRYLRKNGINHFTYHVGEDFVHLLSGLRSIFEAVEFLDLRQGDRIGHGTAAAIDATLWSRMVGDELYIKKGEWLDNLIFLHYFIMSRLKCHSLSGLLDIIGFEISKFGEEIYRKNYSTNEYTNAWLMRKYYPQFLFKDFSDSYLEPYFDFKEWFEIQDKFRSRNLKQLAQAYHGSRNRIEYDKLIKIKAAEIFDIDALKALQDSILEMLYEKEIVIETLPTSNVRISYYDTIQDHHIWRLLNITDNPIDTAKKVVPPVVVGSDDPGIFSTNIFIEYALIYETLVDKFKMDRNDAIDQIKKLERNSFNYRFE